MSTFSQVRVQNQWKEDKFMTDMISSVDGELVFDLKWPEGMTTSPMVDQILAYAKGW
jgi:hypothetical protein